MNAVSSMHPMLLQLQGTCQKSSKALLVHNASKVSLRKVWQRPSPKLYTTQDKEPDPAGDKHTTAAV
jgi:hypothetical protein